jgi:hypothetical protein
MKQLKLAESFLDDKQELSLFDVVLPLLKMSERGVPEALLGPPARHRNGAATYRNGNLNPARCLRLAVRLLFEPGRNRSGRSRKPKPTSAA